MKKPEWINAPYSTYNSLKDLDGKRDYLLAGWLVTYLAGAVSTTVGALAMYGGISSEISHALIGIGIGLVFIGTLSAFAFGILGLVLRYTASKIQIELRTNPVVPAYRSSSSAFYPEAIRSVDEITAIYGIPVEVRQVIHRGHHEGQLDPTICDECKKIVDKALTDA